VDWRQPGSTPNAAILRLNHRELLLHETRVVEPTLVSRVISRYEHELEVVGPPAERWANTAPVEPRVYARPAAATVALLDDAQASPFRQPSATPLPPPRPADPFAEAAQVDQLTDRVMSTIEQRLIAAKERLGLV
jgi:hypothetical protein